MAIKLHFIILNHILNFSTLEEYLDKENIHQFCDVEEDVDNVNKFIDIFFPDFKNIKLEKILALLRPDLFQEKKGKK